MSMMLLLAGAAAATGQPTTQPPLPPTDEVIGPPPADEDPDAKAYLDKVEAADGQRIELAVRAAVDAFVKGCKADTAWERIQCAGILMGARTLAGALVPLIGPDTTNNNFVNGDYNRKTGLTGDGATKFINTNYSNSVTSHMSQHIVAYISKCATTATGGQVLIGANGGRGSTYIWEDNSQYSIYVHSRSPVGGSFPVENNVFFGASRTDRDAIDVILGGTTTFEAGVNSETPFGGPIYVLAGSTDSAGNPPGDFSVATLSFYSVGHSMRSDGVTFKAFKARVDTLVSAIAAATP